MDVNTLNPANSYQREIFEYIKDYHPQLFLNMKELEELIILKAKNAKKAYEDALNRGENELEAQYKSNEALYSLLEFSPCSFIKNYYEELFNDIIDNYQAVQIWVNTKDIFEKYGDDIEGNEREDELRNELKPFIIKFPEKQN